jgi:hypothetical protein
MTSVTILEVETTSMGDVAELILEPSFVPAIGMMLMDQDSLTWEITGILHDSKRNTEEAHGKRWTFQCQPVSTDKSIHPGEYKLIH